MFLIEYKKGQSVNANLIDWIKFNHILDGFECIVFTLSCFHEQDGFLTVSEECHDRFINHLNALNNNN